jgi:glycosyltransferase involved in cell wall biosynthesis
MKIIQLIQRPQRRGAEIFAAQLSEHIRLNGHDVLLISIYQGDAVLPFKGDFVKMDRPNYNRFFDFAGWRGLADIVREFQPDIVQANAADTLKFSVFSKRIFGWRAPVIYRNANQMGDFIRNRFHQIFNQYLLNQVSGIVSVSVASARDLNSTFDTRGKKSIVIPIGVDPKEIDRGVKENVRAVLPENFLLQVGGLVSEKDPLGMVDIFSTISKNQPDLQLVFLGSGSLRDKLMGKISVLGLEGRVHVVPSQQNIFPVLLKAEALVMPSKIEGLPGVILEAMYCRVPVIAYGVGGIPEILKNGTGWCIPPGQTTEFLNAINHVLFLNNSGKNQILSNAYQIVNSSFPIEKIAHQFEKFYSEFQSMGQN